MQKVIIADRNRLLREMLARAFSSNQNLQIVKVFNSYQNLFEYVEENRVAWLIISLPSISDELPDEVKAILASFPETQVLAISSAGRYMRIKWLDVHEEVLDGVGLDQLIELLSKDISELDLEKDKEEKEKEQQ